MPILYQMLDDNTVQVQAPDGSWSTPMATAQEIALFDKQIARWSPLALDNELRTGIPAAFTLGIIAGESNGVPTIKGHDPGGSTGLGLMQITAKALKQGLSDDEVMIPENNVRLGTDAMATSVHAVGYDLPKIASMFNCGGVSGPHLSPSSPWGYCEYKLPNGSQPYISRVVRNSNYAVTQNFTSSPPSSGGGGIGKTLLTAALAGAALGAGVTLVEDAGWFRRFFRG